MQTHVTRNSLIIAAFWLSLQIGTMAQGAPGPKAPLPEPAAMAPVDNSTSSALDYLFHEKPKEGTMGKAGSDVASVISDKIKAIDMLKTPGLDDPVLRARFETYLSLKEVPEDQIKEYFDKMAQAREVLKTGNTFAAWKILYAMSEYKEIDAGISRELANRVESVWTDNRTKDGLAMANEKLRSSIDTANHNADLIADDLHYQEMQDRAKTQTTHNNNGGGQNNNQNNNQSNVTNSPLMNPMSDPVAAEAALMPTMGANLERKMELTSEYLKLLEARAGIKLNEIQSTTVSDQGRRDFAEYVKSLYDTHRYYHMIIASDFYRALFNQGDYPASMIHPPAATGGNTGGGNNNTDNNRGHGRAQQQQQQDMAGQAVSIMESRMPGSQTITSMGISNPFGQNPGDHPVSMAEQVTAALETNNRVSQAIEVFKYKANKNEVAAAAEQLQEAFVGNEFHPELLALQRTEKEKVGEFLSKLSVLKNQLESRDFEQVEAQIGDVKKVAADFDSTKTLALVNGIKLESRLRLGKARLLAQQQQLSEAMNEFQTAAEEWPGNPDLQTSASKFFDTEDVQNQSTTDFDRLVQEQNYRAIFDKQLAFAAAIRDDTGRQQQLKDALVKVKNAEMASEKANLLVMNGDVSGAWETVENATKAWPDDQKLNKLLADLSGRDADFVSAVNKARDAESKKELGYSLTWYVNAQNFYPASTIANEGIDRIKQQLLSPQAPSAAPLN